ncbi:hemin-degrading factor [Xylophilus sp. GOD-11R]|uniref:hemin-degrading factor n=1 Tax=Xylophilus sp. GOD-11R TaxID=3089814 RepID=UPI00298C3C5F|nr:ChuX/HutX family heme-like substrate-binding protein [Xylophilus sp. GOD-11R]WPB55248.1 ChuX/HutX family heme-like substrate-binding protein [Xylophilus sp. GOD-11R]
MNHTTRRHFHRLALAAGLPLGLLARAASAAEPGLADRWDRLRAEQPRLPARDAARTLGVSEAELLATRVGSVATRLQEGSDAAREIMRRVLGLGEITAITRNEHSVIETTGVPRPLPEQMTRGSGDAKADEERRLRMRNVVGYLGGPIDLRIDFAAWRHAFAVTQPGAQGKTSRSLQFFDAQGQAVHKVYLTEGSDLAAFDRVVADFAAQAQSAALTVEPAPPRPAVRPDSAIDLAEFRLAWNEITDVHQFARLLTDFKVERQQALRLAPAGKTAALEPLAVRSLLHEAAAKRVAIMAFVGNRGVTQIFSGTVTRVEEAGGYFNVLDPTFNLHLRDRHFRSAWLIERGNVVSVEFYDDQGDLAVSFFGVHARGEPQPEAWKALARGLPRLPA